MSSTDISKISQKHFTLIEILLVVSVILILATLGVSSLARSKQKAHEAYCANNLRQLGLAANMYLNDYKKYPYTERFLDDFTQFYFYTKSLPVFVCKGSPFTISRLPDSASLVGKTDYLYCFMGTYFVDLEKNAAKNNSNKGNGGNNGMGNNIGPYQIDPSNPKFQRVVADKIQDLVIYDRRGPAHSGRINLCFVLDTRVETRKDMCNLWLVGSNGRLILDSVEPFPR